MIQRNMSLTGDASDQLNTTQRIGTAIGLGGLLILLLATFNIALQPKALWLTIALVAIAGGTLLFSRGLYKDKLEGIKNHGVFIKSISSRGFWGWIAGISATGFYVILYFYAGLLGQGQGIDGTNTGLVALFDPLSKVLTGGQASQWFVYGTLYTVGILAFGIKFIWKYRHNKYQQLRTISVMFFQTAFAFLIPNLMSHLNSDDFSLPFYDFKLMWPLDSYAFDNWRIDQFINAETVGLALLFFAIATVFIISPILTYKYGKRWYCSWVCGCGGLAETVGDSFRQLSDKSMFAWKVERWVIHSVIVFSMVTTIAVVYTYLGYEDRGYWLDRNVFLIGSAIFFTLLFAVIWYFKKDQLAKDARYGAIGYLVIILSLIVMHYTSSEGTLFLIEDYKIKKAYGFLIGSIFSGVIGTGFYPILGNRVWCRMGCPMAGILGIQQRLFSKFRITTNGGQCISCGNCSTYCEQGIDVRAYAQKGENIVRASCVGCGVCSAVCPRGVLKLENGPLEKRIDSNQVLLGANVDLMDYVNGK